MLASGRLVSNIPKAMGSSNRGSYFFLIARYIRKKESNIMMYCFQSPELNPI